MGDNRHFIFSHKCSESSGSSFTVDSDLFCETSDRRVASGGFRCPNCNQLFDYTVCANIKKFFDHYKSLSASLGALEPFGLSIEESPACKRETWESTTALKSYKAERT